MHTARELADTLAALLHREHDALAEFLVAVAEFDKRRAWMELGHASLFSFLNRELKLSKAASQYRKVAAELIQAVPAVAEALRRGDLCLNSIIEVAKVVTPENWNALLPRFHGLSRREAEVIVAELQPHPAPPLRTLLTAVPVPPARPSPAPALDLAPVAEGPAPEATVPVAVATSRSVSSSHEPGPSPAARGVPAPATELVPLTAELLRLHVTVSKAFARKLEAATHARADLQIDELLEAGLDLVLKQSAKRKGLTDRPQKNPRPSKHDDHIPAHVKREVMARSGGRCEARLASGEVCGSTHDPEFHHRTARALGGKGTSADEVMLTCRGHNDLFARQDFGHEVMDRCTGRNGRTTAVAPYLRAVQPRP